MKKETRCVLAMHSAWTYYGTSGGGLFFRGVLVGLHSSWDSATATRHGVHYRAMQSMLHALPQQSSGEGCS